MAGGGGQHSHGHDNLVLTTQYSGIKATQFFSRSSEAGAYQLKRDLEKLRFPSPKMQNIKFVSHGCIMATWIDPNDHIRQCLDYAVYRPTLYKPRDLDKLSIRSFALNIMPQGAPEALYYDIPYVQSRSLSTPSSSNSLPKRPRLALQKVKPGPSTLPPRPQSQAQMQQSRTGSFLAPAQHQQGVASTSNHALQGKPTSTVKRPAEVHDLNGIPRKRVKIDPLKNSIGTVSSSNPPSTATRNSEPAMRKVAETNTTYGKSASPAGSNNGQHGSMSQADIPTRTTSSLVSTSLSSYTNATVSSLPKQVTPRSHPTPQPTPMSHSPAQKPNAMSSAQVKPLNLHMSSVHKLSTWPSLDIPNPAQSSGLSTQPGEGKQDPKRKIVIPVGVMEANGRRANTENAYDGCNAKPQPANGAVVVNQPPQCSSTSHLNSTAPTMKEDQIKELKCQLNLLRWELHEKLDQELKLYRQIEEIGPTDYPKCFMTRVKAIQQALKEREKDLEDARKMGATVENALENEREKLKKSEEELQEGRKVQVEIEGQFKSEQDKRIQLERELSGERAKCTEVEEELQKEGKLRIKAEDALMKNDVACQAMKVELDKSLALTESVRKEEESLKESLKMEWANQVTLHAKTNELEQRLDEESKRRAELEEALGRERSLRLGAEAMLKDVERECRAPFVVPALLEAFTTISNLTTKVMEADVPACK